MLLTLSQRLVLHHSVLDTVKPDIFSPSLSHSKFPSVNSLGFTPHPNLTFIPLIKMWLNLLISVFTH